MNTFTLVTAKLALGITLASGLAMTPHAHAAPIGVDAYAYESTVNLSELPTIDSMPVCQMEDGSDIDPALLPCVWTNDGNAWLTFTDRSFLIVDDTAV
jgi:hypothetical protein